MSQRPVPTKKSEQGVRPVHDVVTSADTHFDKAALAKLGWDDLRIFHAVARSGSLRAAAVSHGLSVNTVRKRIERLEHLVKTALLVRDYTGVRTTPAGNTLAKIANNLRGAAASSGLTPSSYEPADETLSIGTSEAIGSAWLTPRIPLLQTELPNLRVNLSCDNDVRPEKNGGHDIGVVWHMPANPDLLVAKLATLHFMPFASQSYVNEYGMPETPEQLLDHKYIEQNSPGNRSHVLDLLVGTERPKGFMRLQTNSSLAIFWAVANGLGIAWMPTYAATIFPKLVPLPLPFRPKAELLYYYHPEARTAQHVQVALEWLKQSFNPVAFPWFSTDFVHPHDFQLERRANVIPLFRNLI